MFSVRLVKKGKENGKTGYLAQQKKDGFWLTYASIFFDGCDWVVCKSSGRIDRFERLCEAKEIGRAHV